jgi:predicted small metal-binding protein
VSGPTSFIRCPCGFEARSVSVKEVIRAAQQHVRDVHGQELTEEQARALIEVS